MSSLPVKETIFNNRKILSVMPTQPLGRMVWFHGGGWCLGSAADSLDWAQEIAQATQYEVCLPDYPLAPDSKYPETNGWCGSVWRELSDEAKANALPTILAGDSSGAHLALCALPMATPDKMVLIYPVTTLLPQRDWGSWKAYTKGWTLSPKLMDYFYDAYCPDTSLRYGASPLEQLNQLPPTLLISAKDDILLDQQNDLIQRFGGKQVIYEGAKHIFLARPNGAEYRARALADIQAFVKN